MYISVFRDMIRLQLLYNSNNFFLKKKIKNQSLNIYDLHVGKQIK
jgi:hypothetical protein